jgi:type II secretory pathway pseudopilin PulG
MTLIELVVAMALFAVFLYMAVGMSGTAMSRTVAQKELIAVQGAFRAASETLGQDARRTGWPNAFSVTPAIPLYSGTNSDPFILAPFDGSMDDQLVITVPVNGVMHVYVYYLASNGQAQYIARDDFTFTNNPSSIAGVPFNEWKNTASTILTKNSTQPVTSTLNQLTHVYFVNRGGTVTMIFVAKMYASGEHEVTYCSNLFIRNYTKNTSH